MDRLYYETVLTPANTPLATPQNTPFPLEDAQLVRVDILVPRGPSGNLGFRFLWAQQQVIPWGNNSFLVTDNEKVPVECNFAMTATGLVIQTYNTDVFDHTIYVRALIRDFVTMAAPAATITSGSLVTPSDIVSSDAGTNIDTLTSSGVDTSNISIADIPPADTGITPDLIPPPVPDITITPGVIVPEITAPAVAPKPLLPPVKTVRRVKKPIVKIKIKHRHTLVRHK